MESFKLNLFFAIGGIFGCVLLVLVVNTLGLYVSLFSSKNFYWLTNNNPFLIISALGLLNLARKIKWQNKVVNYLSSLSLFMYLTHSNPIIFQYFFPLSLIYIHSHFGYAHIVAWLFMLSVTLFVVSAIFSVIYKEIVKRLFRRIIDTNFTQLSFFWRKFENRLL